MADGFDPNAMNAAMAQWAARMSAAQGQGGSGVPVILSLLPGFGRDINVGSGTTIQGQGLLKADGKVQYRNPVRPGFIGKVLADMGLNGASILDGMKKVADAGAPRQVNSITEITGSGMPSAGPVGGPTVNDGGRSA